MPGLTIDHAAARAALASAASRVAGLVAGSDATLPVPGLGWTVGETAAHVAMGLRAYTDALSGDLDGWAARIPPTRVFRDRLGGMNARWLDEEPLRDPAALAPAIASSCRAFLDASSGHDPAERVPTPWYAEGASLSLDQVTCLLAGEQLVHGYDIARAARRPWPLDAPTARVVVHATAAMMPLILDPVAAAGVHGSWDMRIRGGPRFVVKIEGETATVEPPGGGAVDCHVVADPAAFLLVGYGRVSQWAMIARGRLLTWGRRPWAALRFKGLFVNP